MRRTAATIAAGLLTVCLAGCSDIAGPQWFSPGPAAVQRTLLENPHARISEGGFARIIMGLDGDVALAQLVAARPDLPAELRPRLNGILKGLIPGPVVAARTGD